MHQITFGYDVDKHWAYRVIVVVIYGKKKRCQLRKFCGCIRKRLKFVSLYKKNPRHHRGFIIQRSRSVLFPFFYPSSFFYRSEAAP